MKFFKTSPKNDAPQHVSKPADTNQGDASTDDPGPVSGLHGGHSDLAKAEQLYTKDSELEALEIVERILRLPRGVHHALGHLKTVLADSRVITLEILPTTTLPNGGVATQINHKLSGGSVPTILSLRGKCFAALLDRRDITLTPDIKARAIENADIMIQLFPEDPWFLVLAAQAYFGCQRREHAIALAERALKLDPKNERTLGCLAIFRSTEGYEDLTLRAILMIDDENVKNQRGEAMDIDALVRARGMLCDSLDISNQQALAWAGLAWLESFADRRKQAIEALRTAQRYDPSDRLVQALTDGFRKAGWFE